MAHFIFMGAFYSVLAVVATTLLFALWRSQRAMRQVEEIRWHSDFHDLPPADRVCRHVLTGRIPQPRMPARLRLPAVRDARELPEAAGRRAGRARRGDLRDVVPARPLLSSRPHVGAARSGRRRHGGARRTWANA